MIWMDDTRVFFSCNSIVLYYKLIILEAFLHGKHRRVLLSVEYLMNSSEIAFGLIVIV
jgi:hypothetical protein